MLSNDLGSLSDWCLGLAAMGCRLGPDQLADLARVLLDLACQVKRLERLPFDPAHLRLDHDDE